MHSISPRCGRNDSWMEHFCRRLRSCEGAAGLAAAWELTQAGRSAVVIEARQRIGGRVYTLHDRGSPVPAELGAEFVHGEAPDSFSIIRSAQIQVAQLPDSHYRVQNRK